MIQNFDQLLSLQLKDQHCGRKIVAVSAAHDTDVLHAVASARRMGLIDAILFGDRALISSILNELHERSSDYQIIATADDAESAKRSVSCVAEKKADFLMKGALQTGLLLSSVLDKECGLREGALLSHVMIYQIPTYGKFLFLTDGGMNPAPNLEQKIGILDNALSISGKLGLEQPKVSLIAGSEAINPKIQATVDAHEIASMSRWAHRNVLIEGPVGLDLAINREACRHKNYESPVNGYTDILVVPAYEVGNGIGKTLTYFVPGVRQAGIVVGAKCPIVLVSRSDSSDSKMLSLLLACKVS